MGMLSKLWDTLSSEALTGCVVFTIIVFLLGRQFAISRISSTEEADESFLFYNGVQSCWMCIFLFIGEGLGYYLYLPDAYPDDVIVTTIGDVIGSVILFLIIYGFYTLFGIRKSNKARRADLAFYSMAILRPVLICFVAYSIKNM